MRKPALSVWTSGAAVAVLLFSPVRAADPPAFDLAGPNLRISVTRGNVTLPIGQVPSLAAGDKVAINADLPADQGARFLLLSAFLRGATNPPPQKWIAAAETWKRKDKDKALSLTVPEGARQFVLFLVPDTGGANGAIADAVRNRPGEFVRATQELNRASLDRARLNSFMMAIGAQGNSHPEYLKTVAPRLARSLSMRLNADCLSRVVELQASCLVENRESLVLADMHSNSMAETLAGAPTDLALGVSSTREGGAGFYSPYIGVVRDLARIFGAFGNPELDYLPALSIREADKVQLLLNTAPSFGKPRSVLVTAMPAIEADTPPQLRRSGEAPVCATKPGFVLPVDGAPLIYATGYARDMALQVRTANGKPVELPVEARADAGGYVLKGTLPSNGGPKGTMTGRLQGHWGFESFSGPEFPVQFPDTPEKDEDPVSIEAGQAIMLQDAAPACIETIALRSEKDGARTVDWKADDAGKIVIAGRDLPPGELIVEIRHYGMTAPAIWRFALQAKAIPLPLPAIATAPPILPPAAPAPQNPR